MAQLQWPVNLFIWIRYFFPLQLTQRPVNLVVSPSLPPSSIGMDMVSGQTKRLHVVLYVVVLSVVAPVGIVIGMVVTHHAGDGDAGAQTLVIGALQGRKPKKGSKKRAIFFGEKVGQ